MGNHSMKTQRLEHAAAALARHMVTHPLGWLPVTTGAAAVAVPGLMHAADYTHGPVGAAAVAAIAAGGWLIAEQRLDWDQVDRRWPASGMLANVAASTIALYGPVASWLPWGVGDVLAASMAASAALGIAWWHGMAAGSRTKADTGREGLRWALDELGISSQTTVSDTTVDAKGNLEWVVTLGHADQGKLDRGQLAWKLDVDAARILIRKVDGASPRRFRVVLFKKSPSSLKSVPHPATVKANTAAGGEWAPGARTVAMGAPLGPAVGVDDVAVISVYEPGYGAKHNLIAGMTGAGKSTLVGAILAHVAASVDAVAAGVDLGKGGETFDDWHDNEAMVSVLCAEGDDQASMLEAARRWLAELEWLLGRTRHRVRLMKAGKVRDASGEKTRVWPASPEHPVIVYFIEEYATALANVKALDMRLAAAIEEGIESLGRAARAAGVSINIITQRPTEDELPTSIRGQLNQSIVGKLKTNSDAGRLAQRGVDFVADLKGGKGLCYVDAETYERPLMSKGFDLSKPKTCAQIAALYAADQPHLAWLADTEEAAEDVDAVDGADPLDDLFDAGAAADGRELAGVRLAGPVAAAAAVDGDADREAAVLAALAAAPAGLTCAETETILGVSNSTAARVLRSLQAAGAVTRTGRGRLTRYLLAAAGTDAAAA